MLQCWGERLIHRPHFRNAGGFPRHSKLMEVHVTRTRFIMLIAAMLCLTLAVSAQQRGKKEFTFKGKIEKLDAKANSLVVNGEKVDGWMAAMTMTYKVDKPDVLKTLKVGDQITAKVYEGDFMTLYDVKVVPPAPGKK